MVIKSIRALALATAIGVIGLNSNHAANPNPPKETPSFGVLKTPALKDVQSLADNWIKSLGQISPEKQKAYQAIWTTPEGTAEKLAASFSLLVPEAAVLLEEARNSKQDPPAEIPTFFKDASKPLFLKANLAPRASRKLTTIIGVMPFMRLAAANGNCISRILICISSRVAKMACPASWKP